MGSPWDNFARDTKKDEALTKGPPSSSAPSAWDGFAKNMPTGSTDPSANPGDPYSFLRSLPRQSPVGLEQIQDMHPLFAQRFANFSREAQTLFPNYQISNGARLDRRGHTENSWHYYGQAADVVPDWNFVNTPENKAKLQNLADKYELHLLDEWGPGSGGSNSHFHVSLPKTLPKGKMPVQQPSGRTRTAGQIEDFARSLAAKEGLDPDLISNLFNAESAWNHRAVSSANAVGLGQMLKGTALPYLKRMGKTWDDYLNNENVQVRTAVAHFKDLMQANGNNPARALAAYNAGPGSKEEMTGLARFLAKGKVDYEETKNYISTILKIPRAQVDSAVSDPNFRSAPGVVEMKARQERGQFGSKPVSGTYISKTGEVRQYTPSFVDPEYSGSGVGPILSGSEMRQMKRNAGDMFSGLYEAGRSIAFGPRLVGQTQFRRSPADAYVTAEAPHERIAQTLLPQLMLRDSVRADGTVDDAAWSVDTMKASINHSLLYLPGVLSKEMRVSDDWHKWREQYNGYAGGIFNPWNWGNGAVMAMGFSDLFGNLPILNFTAEKIIGAGKWAAATIPGVAAGKNIVQSATGKAISTGADLLAEKMPAMFLKPGEWAANHLIEPVFGYLAQKGQLGNAITWGTVFGLEGMNKELQHQLNQGRSYSEATWPALMAGRNNAIMGGAIAALFPAAAGTAYALARGTAKFGPEYMSAFFNRMKDGSSSFGEIGQQVAALLENMWHHPKFPEPVRNALTAMAESNAKLMTKDSKHWFEQLVRDSTHSLAVMDHAARNETAHVDMIETTQQAIERSKYDISSIETGITRSKDQLKKAQSAFQQHNVKMTTLEQDFSVSQYKAAVETVERLQANFEAGGYTNANGQFVSYNQQNGKYTPQGARANAELTRNQQTMSQLEQSLPQTVGEYAKLRRDLPTVQGAVAEAQNSPFLLEESSFRALQSRLKAGQQFMTRLVQGAEKALVDGKIPNYQDFVTANMGVSTSLATAEEKAAFELTAKRLAERAQMATVPRDAKGNVIEDATRVPLVQRELQLEVDAHLLASSSTRDAAQKSVDLIESAVSALQTMKGRTKGQAAARLNHAEQQMQHLLNRLKGREKPVSVVQPVLDANGAPVIDKKTGQPKLQKVTQNKIVEPGAIEFIPASVKEKIEGVIQGKNTPADALRAVLDYTDDVFPNGIPISVLSGGAKPLLNVSPEDVIQVQEAMSQISSLLMSENAVPAMSAARAALENVAAGRPKALDSLSGPYSYIERVRDQFQSRSTALNDLVRSIAKIDSIDEVFGGASYFADHMMAYEKAALRVADEVTTSFNKEIQKIVPLRSGERLPADFRFEMANAIDGGKQKMNEFLMKTHKVTTAKGTIDVDGMKMLPAFRMYFDVMTAVERYKQASPELSALFRANYFLHSHPRFLAYMQRGGDDKARMSPFLSSEQARKYPTLEDGQKAADTAWEEIVRLSTAAGKEIRSWEDFVFGFRGNSRMSAQQQRAKALGLDFSARNNISRVDNLLHDVLLGDPVTDIGELLHTVVHSTFRADGARRFMHQLRQMNGPEGVPLLYSIGNKKYKTFERRAHDADVREIGMLPAKRATYVNVDTIPAFAGYSGGKGVGTWFMHPQAANLIEKYLTSPGSAGSVEKMYAGWRGLSLIGMPTSYIMSLMSNYSTLFAFNMQKAFGLLPMGEKMAEDQAGIMMVRALNAGLQPASLLRNAGIFHEDLIQATAQSPIMKEIAEKYYGYNNPLTAVVAKTGGRLLDISTLPFKALEAVDSFVNSAGMFRALSNAQLGAWAFYTGQIMRTKGPELMEQISGNAASKYAGALTIAEKFAADHINRLAGVVRHHSMSPPMRNALRFLALAPQYAGSKWDTVVDALDGVISMAGGRSRHAFKIAPALEAQRKLQLSKYLAGTMIGSVLFNNFVNIYTKGRPTWENARGHELDIDWGDGTYSSLPVFAMFRPLLKTAQGLAFEGNLKKGIDSFFGQLHPFFRTSIELMRGKTIPGDQPLWPPDAVGKEALKEYFRYALTKSVNVGDLLGVQEGVATLPPEGAGPLDQVRHYFGSPMTSKDLTLMALGMSTGKPRDEAQIDAQKVKNLTSWAESRMSEKIGAQMDLAMRDRDNPPEFKKKLSQIVDFAMNVGIDPGSKELSEYFIAQGIHPDGRYVMKDGLAVMNLIENKLNPDKAAYDSLSVRMRPMLFQMIFDRQKELVRDELERQQPNVTDQDVINEMNRRNMRMSPPTEYVPTVPKPDPLMYSRSRQRFAPGVDPYHAPLPTYTLPENPLAPPTLLLNRRRR